MSKLDELDEVLNMTPIEAAHELNRLHRRRENSHREWSGTPRTPASILEHGREMAAINMAIDALLGKKRA